MIDQCAIINIMENEKKPARASLPKSALARLYFIDQQIASGKYPNTKYLVSHLHETWGKVSVSTIGRDIDFMRDRLFAPIEYDALHRGYYYSKPNYRIPVGFSGADELLALGMAKNILTMYRDTPIYDAAQHLLESIIAPLAAEDNSDWYESRIVVPQVPSASVPPDVWDPVTTALRENRSLARAIFFTRHREKRRMPFRSSAKPYRYQMPVSNSNW
jgi:hypothetical protein